MDNETAVEKIAKIEKETRRFQCPHCKTLFQFLVTVDVRAFKEIKITKDGQIEKAGLTTAPRDPLSPEQRALIEEVKAAGVLDPFIETVRQSGNNQPRYADAYFLQWLSKADRVKTPQFALRPLLPDGEDSGDLQLWTHGMVSAILADGEFRLFLPTALAKGRDIESLVADSNGLNRKQHYSNVQEWVKTRNGYVVGRGLMFDSLKRKAAGNFDTLGI